MHCGIMCHSDLLFFIFVSALSFCPQQKEAWWRALWIPHSRRTRRKRARWEVATGDSAWDRRPQLRHKAKLHAVPPSAMQARPYIPMRPVPTSIYSVGAFTDVADLTKKCIHAGSAWDDIMLCETRPIQFRPSPGTYALLSKRVMNQMSSLKV